MKNRSLERFDDDLVYRYGMLMCLFNAPPLPSDKDALVDLLMEIDPKSQKDIEKFQRTYSSDQALLFYSRDPIIYVHLNRALRTKNHHHLVRFRFILQDIHQQLRQRLEQEPADQVLVSYRSQRCSTFDMLDVLHAFEKHAPVAITSFFSTSKSQKIPIDYLDRSRRGDLSDTLVLFKVTARKQDASNYFPFSDISKMSNHPDEEEVLFSPGQMFHIEDMKVEFKSEIRVYSIALETTKNIVEKSDDVTVALQPILNRTKGDGLLALGFFLLMHERFDEAKDFFRRCLPHYDDEEKQ